MSSDKATMGNDDSTPKSTSADQKSCVTTEKKKISDDVDPVLLDSLISIGMDKTLSKKALMFTQNTSVDAALQWIAELGAEEMEAFCDETSLCDSSDSEDFDVSYKMVFVVNTEYGMGTGKIAAQVAHAALGLYRFLETDREKYRNSVQDWEFTGEKKISLRGRNSAELLELQENAEKNELPTYIVEDAGKTQIPEGALTVLAIFGDEDAVNDVTGHLKLL